MAAAPLPRGLVHVATRLLPAGEPRARYRRELDADLSVLDRPHQLTYAVGVLSTSWRLRRELTQEADAMTHTTARRVPLLCRLDLHHHWHYELNPEDRHRSRRCARCGKDDPRLGDPGLLYAPKDL